jgi:hypothetical protein
MMKTAKSHVGVRSRAFLVGVWVSVWLGAAMIFGLEALAHAREANVLAMGWCGNSPLGVGKFGLGVDHCPACYQAVAAALFAFAPFAGRGGGSVTRS